MAANEGAENQLAAKRTDRGGVENAQRLQGEQKQAPTKGLQRTSFIIQGGKRKAEVEARSSPSGSKAEAEHQQEIPQNCTGL